MGRVFMMEAKEFLGREQGLRAHLSCNWFPPLPLYLQNVIVEEFERHWKDRCHPQVLLERINRRLKKIEGEIVGLKSLDRFDEFLLNEEEWKEIPIRKPKNEWAFPKAKVKRILKSVRNVFKHSNIDYLTDEAYQFITLKMGFIAHYDLFGFRETYCNNLLMFARHLLTTEGLSRDESYNERWADRQEKDSDFIKRYGEEYCKRSAETIRGIVKIARRMLNSGDA